MGGAAFDSDEMERRGAKTMDDKRIELAREYATLLRRDLGARLKEILLFGSSARGDASEGSDFDVILVVDRRTPQVREAVLDAEIEMMNRHEALFATLLFDEEQWYETRQFPLGWCVEQEGVVV